MSVDYDVVVVGAGVEGTATAYHLAKAGQKTLLLEQFPLPHSRGSSHGQTRITRNAYTQDFYTQMMKEATEFWQDLQRNTHIRVLESVGYLQMGSSGDDEQMKSTQNALSKNGAPYTLLDNAAFSRRFPMFNYPATYEALYDPNGGVLRADRILNIFQSSFKSNGGELRDGTRVHRVTPVTQNRVTVTTDKGDVTSRSVVLCCGPWASELIAPLGLRLPLQPVRISVCYWKVKVPGSHSADKLPTFFEPKCCVGYDIYGLPSVEYPDCIKICLHHGPDIHPDRRDAVDDKWVRNALSQYVRDHMPGLEPTPVVVETCIYTNTPDKNFILDTHPNWKNIVIGAGFSGHGFKLAPAVGRVLSELAQGKDPTYDLTPFRIERFLPKARM